MLAAVGIETADDLREVGAAMAYRMMRHRFGSGVNRLALWALAGALQDRYWTSFTDAEKDALDADARGHLDVGAARPCPPRRRGRES